MREMSILILLVSRKTNSGSLARVEVRRRYIKAKGKIKVTRSGISPLRR